jgi:DNA-binding IclR family transcriptional regulator
MACVNPDVTLTSSAQAILAAMQMSNRPEDIAQATGLPLYRVRSSLRELGQLGVVVQSSGSYMRTGSGAPQDATARR